MDRNQSSTKNIRVITEYSVVTIRDAVLLSRKICHENLYGHRRIEIFCSGRRRHLIWELVNPSPLTFFSLLSLQNHTSSCAYLRIPCVHCGEMVKKADLTDHLQNECMYRLETCRFCKRQIPLNRMKVQSNFDLIISDDFSFLYVWSLWKSNIDAKYPLQFLSVA